MAHKNESKVDKGATLTAVTSAKAACRQDTVAATAGAAGDEEGSNEWHEVKTKRKIDLPKFVKNKRSSPPADESLVPAEVERVVPTFDEHRHHDNT
eukprot:783638-Prorocentrum_minimum.AAC.1